MPYSREAGYYHYRKANPRLFEKSSFRTVPLSHTDYKGRLLMVPGAQAVVGKIKRSGKWKIQKIEVPKG